METEKGKEYVMCVLPFFQRAFGLDEGRIEKCLEVQEWEPIRQEINSLRQHPSEPGNRECGWAGL